MLKICVHMTWCILQPIVAYVFLSSYYGMYYTEMTCVYLLMTYDHWRVLSLTRAFSELSIDNFVNICGNLFTVCRLQWPLRESTSLLGVQPGALNIVVGSRTCCLSRFIGRFCVG